MITHVIVELKYPVEEEYFLMDTVFPNEYYGYGTPLVRCKDCKHYTGYECIRAKVSNIRVITDENEYCSRAERKT